jgi:hypothetical protein
MTLALPSDPMPETRLLIVFLLVLLAVGTFCLFFPRNVQALAVKAIESGPTSRIRALRAFVQSASYLVNLRVVGIGAYAICLLLMLAVFKAS